MQRSKVVIEGHPDDCGVSQQSVGDTLKTIWPIGGAQLAAGVRLPGLLPVTEATLGEVVRRLVTVLDPEKIVLFGSYAYGSPSNDSDVDMLVILQMTASPADRYVAVSRAIRPRPFPLDFLLGAARWSACGIRRDRLGAIWGTCSEGFRSHEPPPRGSKTVRRHDPS